MRETFVAPPELGKVPFKIILADGNTERASSFRINGSGYHLRVLKTQAALKEHFSTPERWDILLHSLFFGSWQEDPLATVQDIVEAFRLKRIRGVVCTTTVTTDARKFIEALRAAGVPCAYYPYNYNNPASHQKVEI